MRDYKAGDMAAYRRVATELFNLLVDTNPRSGPLLMRVLPEASFHRFHEPRSTEPTMPGKGAFMIMDTRGGALSMSSRPGEFLFVLPTDGALISVNEWLDDWYSNPEIVIREVIREVRNKDAGHTDPFEGPTMEALRHWRGLAGGNDIETKRSLIIGIGDYVAGRVRELLAAKSFE
ncbi:MAG: hypothetical protein AB7I38_02800 [Dehalococcoidia bacterium]